MHDNELIRGTTASPLVHFSRVLGPVHRLSSIILSTERGKGEFIIGDKSRRAQWNERFFFEKLTIMFKTEAVLSPPERECPSCLTNKTNLPMVLKD